jgi:very-short-patch-repair endonuclease
MTPAEWKLWYAMRAHRFQGLHVRREVPMGRYVADFVCHTNRIVIEVDGAQHGFDGEVSRDAERDAWFESQGYRVLRFWNREVLHEFESVLDTIYARAFGAAAS